MNTKSRSDSYAAAGVDITAGYRAVELMKSHIAKTVIPGVMGGVGGFGGCSCQYDRSVRQTLRSCL